MIHYHFTGLKRHTRAAANEAWAKGRAAIAYVDSKIDSAPQLNCLSDGSRKFLRNLRGKPPFVQGLPMSSRNVRAANGIATIETTLMACRNDRSLREGHSRLRMLTLKPDVGLVNIEDPDYPAALVRWRADRLARAAVADGLFQYDLASFCHGRGHPEHAIGVHVHGEVSFDVAGTWKREDWLKKLAPRSGNVNVFGDTIVNISSRGTNRNPKLTPSKAAGLGWYISKETAGVNTFYESKRGRKSEGNHTDWTFTGALRQLEFWSHLNVFDVCWSQGPKGNAMRTAWRRKVLELLEYCEMPQACAIDSGRTHEGWARVWRELDNGFAAINPDAMRATTQAQLRQAGMVKVDFW